MHTIQTSEAIALLSSPTFCVEPPDWTPLRRQPENTSIAMGLVDSAGIGTRLQVHLEFRLSSKTRIKRYVFTIFRQQPSGLERVYQLDVTNYPKPVRVIHQLPHEHLGGDQRTSDATWASWSYDEVMDRFCRVTNVQFQPRPDDPATFKLTP